MTPHGVKDATTDLDQIETWWSKNPKANIGIAPGQKSGVLVLDSAIMMQPSTKMSIPGPRTLPFESLRTANVGCWNNKWYPPPPETQSQSRAAAQAPFPTWQGPFRPRSSGRCGISCR
jgi:hypothetical protein